jgi:hypothetical protein
LLTYKNLPSGEKEPSTGEPLKIDEFFEKPKSFNETESGIVFISSKVFAS